MHTCPYVVRLFATQLQVALCLTGTADWEGRLEGKADSKGRLERQADPGYNCMAGLERDCILRMPASQFKKLVHLWNT